MSRAHSGLMCRSCGATPAQRREEVSDAAVEYLCSRCLFYDGVSSLSGQRPGQRYPEANNGITHAPRFRHLQHDKALHAAVRSGRAHKPGRPRVSEAQKRQKTRERVRVFRARRRDAVTTQPAVGM